MNDFHNSSLLRLKAAIEFDLRLGERRGADLA